MNDLKCWLESGVKFYDGDVKQSKFRQVTTMKLKLVPALAGALAFAVIAAPLAVKAQPGQSNQPVQPQVPNQPKPIGVELTQQQKTQMNEIRRDTRARIEKLLTPQQQEQFKTALQSRQGGQAAFAAMKLSPEQQNQLQGILQSAQARAEAILTPEQRQQLQQNFQQQRKQ